MTGRSVKFVLSVCVLLTLAVVTLSPNRRCPPKPRQPWKVGYWIWPGDAPAQAAVKPEILYVQLRGSRWPKNLPDAERYFVVRRIEPWEALSREKAIALAEDFKALVADAPRTPITGLQIDYDSPTNQLTSYGRFLAELRQALPPGSSLSITALLDWFRPDTPIESALAWVDEFVPQFYDVSPTRQTAGIAAPIDAAKWAPVFDAYRVPYRLGVASFGRIARRRVDEAGHPTVHYFRDRSPLDFAGRSGFRSSAETNAVGERIVRYDVLESIPSMPDLHAGDAVEITFPAESSVRAGFEAARHFGEYCAGVLFFRWPNRSERLALSPDDIQRIVSGKPLPATPEVEARTTACLKRECSDLYLDPGANNSVESQTVAVRVSGPMELFLPDGPLRTAAARPNRLLVNVPAFPGLGRIYLGRMIASGPIHVEVIQP